ncbi:MBL protein, partial [Burhinus bistriatus]|nr:MBL protein [Burhinus bistriatus]
MTFLQPFNALELWLSLLMVISSVNTDNPEEKIYSCPVIQCTAPAVNGLPGRDGRDDPRVGEKLRKHSNDFILNHTPGEGLRGLQGFPGKAGPPGIKGDLGPQGEKRGKGEHGNKKYIFHRQVSALKIKVQVLEAELNRYKKGLILKNIKNIGKKIFVSTGKEVTFDNGKSLCAKARSALISPRNEASKDLIKLSKQAYMAISDEQTEGRFMHLNRRTITYTNRNAGEPNNLKNEGCAVIQDSGKWNDVNCSNSRASIICEF